MYYTCFKHKYFILVYQLCVQLINGSRSDIKSIKKWRKNEKDSVLYKPVVKTSW